MRYKDQTPGDRAQYAIATTLDRKRICYKDQSLGDRGGRHNEHLRYMTCQWLAVSTEVDVAVMTKLSMVFTKQC